jgi:UDP-glucose 4-epimerase
MANIQVCGFRRWLTYVPSRGTGYIGSFTALALLEAGYKVVIVDSLYNSSAEVINRIELICGKRPDFEKLDITDEKALDEVFTKHPDIDSVIHFAALKVRTDNLSHGDTAQSVHSS